MYRYSSVCLWVLLLGFTSVQAQPPSASKPVKGGGTAGQLTKWTSPDTIGDSIVIGAETRRARGYYIHPELYEQPEERNVEWARRPELMNRVGMMKQKR